LVRIFLLLKDYRILDDQVVNHLANCLANMLDYIQTILESFQVQLQDLITELTATIEVMYMEGEIDVINDF
jgi:hypothetical protein